MPMNGALKFHKFLQFSDTVTTIDNVPTYIGVLVATNTTAAAAYIQIFYKASGSVTLGTTVADAVIPLPASGGVSIPFPDCGWLTSGTSWSVAGTTTATGSTAAICNLSIWRKL